MKLAFFFARDFLSPVAGATETLPNGVPFESLSFLYPPPTHFFDFKFLMENRPFFRPRFFILTDGMDGWMDGWMDGMGWDGMDGRSTFFFGPYLENYFIIFLNCSSSLKYMFLHIF